MTADALLGRLDKVRARGRGQWSARCPAHEDRGPSLSIRELDDGRVLLHCFGGCNVHAIVAAVGLDIADLFPPRDTTPGAGAQRERRPFSAQQLLDLAAFESSIVVLVTADLVAGRDADRGRLIEAAARLQRIAEVARGV
ncbi:MAG: DNA primase [Burkholderiaceae bacterium]|nr:DNA primase [Burkholderiaceae bacterium]